MPARVKLLTTLLLVLPALAAGALPRVGPPPAALVSSLALKPFYRKHVDARGFPIVSSEQVSDYALLEAAYLVDQMLEGRDDVRQALVRSRVRLAVMAPTEMTTDVPEHSDLKPANYWDKRARGLGATRARPAVSCGEENLLGYPGDPYAGENILVHEFAHAIHEMGLRSVDPGFDSKLRETYRRALDNGLWKGAYAATNPAEYWAEGVQSWFDCNQKKNPVHNGVRTREELQAHDPGLAALIDSVFPNKAWRYLPPAARAEKTPSRARGQAHLEGYRSERAPRFRWDPGLLEWNRKYEEVRRKYDVLLKGEGR
jgi:hypothetical protein